MDETIGRADDYTPQNITMFDATEREWVREFHGYAG